MEREFSDENQENDPSEPHGAIVRYRVRAQNRLTSEQVRKTRRHSTRRSRGSRGATSDRTFSQRFSNVNTAELQRVYQNIHDLFEKSGESVNDTEINEMRQLGIDRPQTVDFPYIIFTIAVLKDISDVLATITIIGAVATLATSFICAIILFIWTLDKMNGGWWKKRLIKGLLIRYGIMVTIEFIPGVNIIPTATIFMLMAHFREVRLVKMINIALEEMHDVGRK